MEANATLPRHSLNFVIYVDALRAEFYSCRVHWINSLLFQLGFWIAVDLAGRVLFALVRVQPNRKRSARFFRWLTLKFMRMKNKRRAIKWTATVMLLYGAFSLFTFKELLQISKGCKP